MTPAEIRTAASIVGKAAKDKTGREAKRLRRITRELRAAARAVAATPRSTSNCRHDAMEG